MLVICAVSLLIGLIIYVVFRPQTYISLWLGNFLKIKYYPKNAIFISFYLPDFLWALSLCSCLFAFFPLKKQIMWLWGAVTFLYGCFWELLQMLSSGFGTADIIDIILYFTAAATVVLINYYFNKEK